MLLAFFSIFVGLPVVATFLPIQKLTAGNSVVRRENFLLLERTEKRLLERATMRWRSTTALMSMLLLSGVASAEPRFPGPSEEVEWVTFQPEETSRVVLQGDWRRTGKARLVLERGEDSTAVENVEVEASLTPLTCGPEVTCRMTLVDSARSYSLRLNQSLFQQARAFAQWDHSEQTDSLVSGLETPVFGSDTFRVRYYQELDEQLLPENTETSLSYETQLKESTQIVVSSRHKDKLNELKGEVVQSVGDGLELSATVESRMTPATLGEFPYDFEPKLQGQLRWAW